MGRFTFVRGPSPSSTEPPPSPSSGMSNPVARSPTWEEGRRAPATRARSSSSTDSGMALERLTDELLSRVPASSDNGRNLVSERWLGLIDHPDHRKRLPQPLAGFFYNSTSKHSLKNRTDDRTGEAAGSDFHLSDRWFFRFNVMMNVMWLYIFG